MFRKDITIGNKQFLQFLRVNVPPNALTVGSTMADLCFLRYLSIKISQKWVTNVYKSNTELNQEEEVVMEFLEQQFKLTLNPFLEKTGTKKDVQLSFLNIEIPPITVKVSIPNGKVEISDDTQKLLTGIRSFLVQSRHGSYHVLWFSRTMGWMISGFRKLLESKKLVGPSVQSKLPKPEASTRDRQLSRCMRSRKHCSSNELGKRKRQKSSSKMEKKESNTLLTQINQSAFVRSSKKQKKRAVNPLQSTRHSFNTTLSTSSFSSSSSSSSGIDPVPFMQYSHEAYGSSTNSPLKKWPALVLAKSFDGKTGYYPKLALLPMEPERMKDQIGSFYLLSPKTKERFRVCPKRTAIRSTTVKSTDPKQNYLYPMMLSFKTTEAAITMTELSMRRK